MIFETHLIAPPISEYIESLFYFKGFQPDHSIERVVPTGHLFIIFELDGFTRNTFDNKTLKPNGSFRHVWVSGMHKNFLSISAHQDSEMLVVQFKTSGARPFFKKSISEFNNKVLDGTDIFGTEILELRQQIIKESKVVDKFKHVEAWLTNEFDPSKKASIASLKVLEAIQTQPIYDSQQIISSYPNSQKHLISEFKTYFGLTPKVFHRIFRFNQILKQIQNKSSLKWTDIAYEFGYTDQSHFIKEFKEFSGFNPQEFIKADYHKEEPNFFPLDREG